MTSVGYLRLHYADGFSRNLLPPPLIIEYIHALTIMSTNLAAWLAPIISIISLFAAQKSYIAITNLRQYEERSERAAKYSDAAAHQLWKTRATQGSSAGAVSP